MLNTSLGVFGLVFLAVGLITGTYQYGNNGQTSAGGGFAIAGAIMLSVSIYLDFWRRSLRKEKRPT